MTLYVHKSSNNYVQCNSNHLWVTKYPKISKVTLEFFAESQNSRRFCDRRNKVTSWVFLNHLPNFGTHTRHRFSPAVAALFFNRLIIFSGEKSGGYTGKPLPTFRPASQLVPLGGAARLFCEAYLGKVELPDAKNSVTWSKSDSNVTLPNHGRIAQHRVSRWVPIPRIAILTERQFLLVLSANRRTGSR